ncbi:MAG: translation initiation factor IF-3 [Candidatus Cyclonatronum sp.]|uniref:translation initiation factor IF-3 n=1 Tax=Cyclonatronum sp. TaxID=3024185 RepID=UPI00341E5D7F|nr:translation initiation factor IF-3 [Balneolales bacterium]MCH8485535.1 translation initiation factor IF-3 [Cyclonatronum sp.]
MGKRYKQYKNYNTERINEDIDAPKVRVIKPDGEHEIVSSDRALVIARGLELDLVEVAADADPPVCRILDYKKFLYEKKKKEKDAKKKQHTVTIKELRFRPHTDDHDYNFKLKHAKSFLEEGNKVKATVQFRGRDIIYSDNGRDLLERFADDLKELGKIEAKPKLEGKRMSLIVAPAK